ncbi:MAG: serine/threonine protein kinase [Acidobacteria bacterium]|nr:MAG: serine/threonine protein kinase [Acidobacteriota bacterium]
MSKQEIGRVILGKYQIESVLMESDEAIFYKGKQLTLEKFVLMKAFRSSNIDVITREVRNLARLNHPNILSLIDYGIDADGKAFIIFEMPEGENLKNLISRGETLSLLRVNELIQQIASAIITAHANGIVHGQLNPQYIYIAKSADNKEFVKVFGFESAGRITTIEEAAYTAPERFIDSDIKDARSDIYSLGIIAYELLTGRVPFVGDSIEEIRSKHMQSPPPPISSYRSDVSDELEAIIFRALAKSVDNRFQTMKGFAESFDFAVNLSKKHLDQSVQPVRASDSNPWKTAFIVFVGMVSLAAVFVYLTQVKQIDPPTSLPRDANSLPVQPINPATGSMEQTLSNMSGFENISNASSSINGKSESVRTSDPWSRGAFIPPPTGQYYDANVNPESPFMPADGNVYIIVPKNTNSNVKPTKTPSANVSNGQLPAVKPTPTPDVPKEVKSSAIPIPKASPKPSPAQSPEPQ